MGCFSLSYANPPLVTSPAWGTQAPHCCESLGHLAAPLASGPITFLSVRVTQPLGSVGSKPWGCGKGWSGAEGRGGSDLPFCGCPWLLPGAGWRLYSVHMWGARVSPASEGLLRSTFLTLQYLTLVPTVQSFCSILNCQTWRAIVKDLQDWSETLRSWFFLIPPSLPFNVCFILLFCLVFM